MGWGQGRLFSFLSSLFSEHLFCVGTVLGTWDVQNDTDAMDSSLESLWCTIKLAVTLIRLNGDVLGM